MLSDQSEIPLQPARHDRGFMSDGFRPNFANNGRNFLSRLYQNFIHFIYLDFYYRKTRARPMYNQLHLFYTYIRI